MSRHRQSQVTGEEQTHTGTYTSTPSRHIFQPCSKPRSACLPTWLFCLPPCTYTMYPKLSDCHTTLIQTLKTTFVMLYIHTCIYTYIEYGYISLISSLLSFNRALMHSLNKLILIHSYIQTTSSSQLHHTYCCYTHYFLYLTTCSYYSANFNKAFS